jgi:hypothetical protein
MLVQLLFDLAYFLSPLSNHTSKQNKTKQNKTKQNKKLDNYSFQTNAEQSVKLIVQAQILHF